MKQVNRWVTDFMYRHKSKQIGGLWTLHTGTRASK